MTYILATNKCWNINFLNNLKKRTAKEFILLTKPEELTLDFLYEVKPKYIFFPHWSHIIPPIIFKQFECVIFHMTDLPFGRGGSPLQNLIANHIYHTQLSAIRCDEEIDSGPIYLKKPLSLEGKAQDIYKKATLLIEEMIIEIIQHQLTPKPQEGEVVVFSRRTPEQSDINQLTELNTVYDYIRMLDADGYPKAFIETDHLRLEFSDALLEDGSISAHVFIRLKKEIKCQK
jgi:methionyl-tRNA formyltransferase